MHCLFEIFSKDLQKPSFTIKNSSEALRFTWKGGGGGGGGRGSRKLNLYETGIKFTIFFWSAKSQKLYPVLERRMLIIYPVVVLPLLLKEKLCIVLYLRQIPYLCFNYLRLWATVSLFHKFDVTDSRR